MIVGLGEWSADEERWIMECSSAKGIMRRLCKNA